jgi:hypothetical protein
MSVDFDSFLGQPQANILLLGTFHFQDRGLDKYKPQSNFAVFSPQRQQEIDEVVNRLAVFTPTKIALERTPQQQDEIDQSYRAYIRGEPVEGDEIYQLGFRLAKKLAHPKVYCVNAWDRHYEPMIDVEAYAREHGQENLLGQWWPNYQKLFEHLDNLKATQSLREILLSVNSEESIRRGHGAYLVDWFKVGEGEDYPGVDWLIAWYNRNLRIFANLQRITERPDERILLIIGAGHLPILHHTVQASPEYKLVEVKKFLG